jgi:hypothetical protein
VEPERGRVQLEPAARHVAAGGWRRAAVGLLVGAAAGVALALVLPRDDGPRRTIRPADRPRPFED